MHAFYGSECVTRNILNQWAKYMISPSISASAESVKPTRTYTARHTRSMDDQAMERYRDSTATVLHTQYQIVSV